MRVGVGTDIHRLEKGRKLTLSGVNVPFDKGEDAHSDGDVIFHAVGDAILGALAIGDLGKFFPDSESKYKDANSAVIVETIVEMMLGKGYIINNIDVCVKLESPKISSFIEEMRKNLANLLRTDILNVSIKAGTNEGLDAIGKGEAVEAIAIVSLKEKGE